MSLIHGLPRDISHGVLASWLDLVDVANLDSAVCIHGERAAYLNSAYAADCVFDYAYFFDRQKTRKGALFYKPEFLQWILLRGITLSSLSSLPKCEKALPYTKTFMEVIRTSGSCLKHVQADMDFDAVKVALGMHCTALERLSCGKITKKWGVDRLFDRCPKLEHLTFKFTDQTILEVLQTYGARIKSLRMANDSKFLPERMQWATLVPSLPNLTELEIGTGCPADTVLATVTLHCPLLRSLKVTTYTDTAMASSSEVMLAVSQTCTLLQRLHLGGGFLVPIVRALNGTFRNLKNLTALSVDTLNVTPDVVQILAEGNQGLREIDFKHLCPHEKKVLFIFLPRWPQLERLCLGDAWIEEGDLRKIGAHCPKLRTFTAHNCQAVTDADVNALVKGCPDLLHIELGLCTEITVVSLEAIVTHCRYLERLTVTQPVVSRKISRAQAAPYLQRKLGDINCYLYEGDQHGTSVSESLCDST